MRCVLQVPRQIALSMTLRMNLMTVMGTIYAVSVHGMDAVVAVQDLHTAEGNDVPQQTMWPMPFTLLTRCRHLLYKCELAIEQARTRLQKTGQESHSPSAWLRRLFDRVFVACESLLPRSS